MIGLFCFDGPLYKDKDGVYCNVTLTNEMFSRYFCVVEKLYIVVRTFTLDKTYKEVNMKPLIMENIEVIEVENFNTICGFLSKKKKFQLDIERILGNIDLIFARMPSQTSNEVLSVARRFQKPYLAEVGGCAWDSFWNHGFLGKLIAPYMYFCARKNISGAAFATYVTKYFLQQRYPNKNDVINCSNVYLPISEESVLLERIKKINEANLQKIVFGQAVNSIDVRYKGEHLVIRAMKKLKDKGIVAEFQVVGPGNGEFLVAEAKKYGVEKQLKLIGTLQKSEIMNWYKSLDVYIQPSKQEGLPRSVIEAMSVGCPALGSDIAGIPELLDRECLFDPDKNEQIVDAIMWILKPENMVNQAKVNFERAKDYNIADIEDRRRKIFLRYCDRVIAEKIKH